eukprot:TRINITY_DN24765_c0_g1_i2.p1 TRINITY_DN24765_c0_g1~~TRINITY_DN24765_c0_g1_i2.p1  ORF type:complete len:295 (-),score=64.43 TRINITY_DN24765_c0_g1_i2:67-876(-)
MVYKRRKFSSDIEMKQNAIVLATRFLNYRNFMKFNLDLPSFKNSSTVLKSLDDDVSSQLFDPILTELRTMLHVPFKQVCSRVGKKVDAFLERRACQNVDLILDEERRFDDLPFDLFLREKFRIFLDDPHRFALSTYLSFHEWCWKTNIAVEVKILEARRLVDEFNRLPKGESETIVSRGVAEKLEIMKRKLGREYSESRLFFSELSELFRQVMEIEEEMLRKAFSSFVKFRSTTEQNLKWDINRMGGREEVGFDEALYNVYFHSQLRNF